MNAIASVSTTAIGARRQRGFSLIEVSIVTAILLLLAIIAIPAVGAYVIENKVPKVGEELARFVLQSQINAQPGTNKPYDAISTAHFANTVLDSGLFSVSGSGQSLEVLHGLGVDGKVVVSTADQGASFSLTLDNVNHAACPALASVMQRVVHTISISGGSGSATPVKSDTLDYSALTAEAACIKGDSNTFVFTAS
ncbi:MAG: type 4 pilus major pilin [Castellaniella sp.]